MILTQFNQNYCNSLYFYSLSLFFSKCMCVLYIHTYTHRPLLLLCDTGKSVCSWGLIKKNTQTVPIWVNKALVLVCACHISCKKTEEVAAANASFSQRIQHFLSCKTKTSLQNTHDIKCNILMIITRPFLKYCNKKRGKVILGKP